MQQQEVLKQYFGYDRFRPGQEELINAILRGQDVLGIMPTGAGKSICYQVPALVLPGITLVISPLISLMMDQVKALNQAGIHAAYINSSLSEGQVFKALQLAEEGRYKIIYVAPERLETNSFMNFAANALISMVTVDEAHCISQWGQDFRPSYLKIVKFINSLSERPIVSAFTATATAIVKEDICCVLGLRSPKVLITGFDRENLYFEVRNIRKKDMEVLNYVKDHSGESGIIYCATRKNVDNLCTFLEEMGMPATKYHAGLSGDERKRNQEDFLYDIKPVMVATNAFGMGIDKSNVRYVIHYNMSQSLENYYQEAGRAGRDGEASECILLYSPQDVMIHRFLIDNKGENQEYTREEAESLKENDMERLRAMTGYCTTKRCLRQYILHYFGEYTDNRSTCGNCSNCLTEYEETDVTDVAGGILRCVRECGQRYGINVIAGVLRGENRAKLRSYGLTEASCFGIYKEMPEEKLKNIMNEMIAEQYLFMTKDKYMLLKLGKAASDVLSGQCRVVIKCLPEQSTQELEPGKAGGRKQRVSDILTSAGLELFDRLKATRLKIAREQAIPPYIVFSDKTLLEMCVKAPVSKTEMLQITGVGEVKYERYGERFLEVVRQYRQEENRPLCFEDNNLNVGSETRLPKRKREFILTEEIREQIHFAEKMTLSDLVGQINDLRDERIYKRLTGKAIMQKLMQNGMVKEIYRNGIWQKEIMDAGSRFGIFLEKRVSEKGTEYEVLLYSEAAQKGIVDKLSGEWRNLMIEKSEV